MPDPTAALIQQQADSTQLQHFAQRLTAWLLKDDPDFTSSRARTLLRGSDVIDAPTLHDFASRMSQETAVRVALHQLLEECELGEEEEVKAEATAAAAMTSGEDTPAIDWDLLTIAIYANKRGYPLNQLDPASPPEAYSPAGQILKRAGYFMRQQVQRSATERDKLAKKVAYQPTAAQTPNLDRLPDEPAQAAVPPYYRPPIPVNYPEVANETLTVSEEETPTPPPAVERTSGITITEDDLVPPPTQPVRQAPLTISEADLQPASPPRRQPSSSNTTTVSEAASEVRSAANGLVTAVRHRFARSREPLTTTRLAVTVQENPNGPGLQGLQVEVRCRGISSFVAGTTNQNGRFLCELPVRQHSGLTYDIDVTWPRDLGGDTERKSITLNADRTQFSLPFYRRSVA